MRDAKSALLDAIRVPDGFDPEWFERVVPPLPDLPPAEDADTAAIAVAKFCVNQNTFLQMFKGVPLLKYLWHGCQLSSPLIGLLLASLEQFDVKVGEIKLITPVDGGLYFGVYDTFKCVISETPTGVVATVDGDDFAMLLSGSGYIATRNTAPGTHHLTITASFGGEKKTISSAFAIKSWEDAISIPANDLVLDRLVSIQLQTNQTDNISTIEFSVNDQLCNLKKDAGRWMAEDINASGLSDLPDGKYNGIFTIRTSAATSTKIVNFSIKTPPIVIGGPVGGL